MTGTEAKRITEAKKHTGERIAKIPGMCSEGCCMLGSSSGYGSWGKEPANEIQQKLAGSPYKWGKKWRFLRPEPLLVIALVK
jgi:hypothetical protein